MVPIKNTLKAYEHKQNVSSVKSTVEKTTNLLYLQKAALRKHLKNTVTASTEKYIRIKFKNNWKPS